jgi:hypothetical protein
MVLFTYGWNESRLFAQVSIFPTGSELSAASRRDAIVKAHHID